MNIDNLLNESLESVPKAVAAGIVDMNSGLMLGIKTTSNHPTEVFDFLAAATKDIFEGENVTAIEDIFKQARGQSGSKERYFQEIVVFSSNLLHYFSRVPSQPSIVYGVVCHDSANIGMLLVRARGISQRVRV